MGLVVPLAYFPCGDAMALAAEDGVTAIEIADRHHLAMVFTGRRHFRH